MRRGPRSRRAKRILALRATRCSPPVGRDRVPTARRWTRRDARFRGAVRWPTRRPPGVALDPSLELPKPAPSAYAESGFAVLTEPVDPEPARRVVAAFFRAVAAEEIPGLERVMEASATTVTSARRPEPALGVFRSDEVRAARLHERGAGSVCTVGARTEDRARRRNGERRELASARARGATRSSRAPVQSFAANRLFGPEVVFLLEPRGHRAATRSSNCTKTFGYPD